MNDLIISEMATLFEKFGVNPILGRIFGLLFTSHKPLSLIEISKELSLSKAAISIQIRILEEMDYCEKIPKTGDRQHYYVLRENYLDDVFLKRIERENSYIQKLERTLLNMDGSDLKTKRRLSEFISFHNLVVDMQTHIIEEWQKRKGELHDD